MMRRREFIALVAAAPLAGCFDDKGGPAEIKYGRDECEMCRMIISDARFATEVRGGPKGKLHKFDDIGDAIHWLKRQGWAETDIAEVWVMDYRDGKTWLDARNARYLAGVTSPMDYGYGAVREALAGSLSFDEMRARVLERGLSSRCEPEGGPADHEGHEH